MEVESATLVVRLIRSFEFGNVKNIVVKNVNLAQDTLGDLKQRVLKEIQTDGKLRMFRSKAFDTFKINQQAHGFKSCNLVINLSSEAETLLTDDLKTLYACGVANECELSFFVRQEYEEYKKSDQSNKQITL
eukprot:GCRY01001609.1.p1 GENE.GCRY01001609.1~~GCRY01001609.1.p1  ORF type:complete len:132 (-),score=24.16 GCRY01001609.1:50-445(-)